MSRISQGFRQCAGISIGVVKEFVEILGDVNDFNKDVIAANIRDEGEKFYNLAIANEPHEVGQGIDKGFIELKSIFDRHTEDSRNEIDLNAAKNLKLRFQTALTVERYVEKFNEMPVLDSYFEGCANDKFSEIVRSIV